MSKLYYGGTILTMENAGDNVEALLTENDKIIKTGSFQKLKEENPYAQLVNLEGKTMMPSFIDGHSHLSTAAQMSCAADLSECTSFQEIIDCLKNYMVEHSIGEDDVIIGWGYDHNFLKEAAHPAKEVLDQVTTTVPIYISHASGHMGCANSAALAMARINENTPDPEGGVIGRVEGSREPDGYLEEAGMLALQMELPKRVKIDMVEGMKNAQQLYLSYGVTTVQDGASNLPTIQMLKGMCDNGLIKIDVVAYPTLGKESTAKECFAQFPQCDGKYDHGLKIGGYKVILDGSPQGKSAWLTKPYENSGDYCAYPWYSDQEVEGFMKQAVEDKKQVLVHCNGDAAGDQYLRAYGKALEETAGCQDLDLRPVMIHCQTAREDQLDLMKEYKMIPSIFVGHVYYWGDVHKKNLGLERASRISPVKSALDRGLVVNFHQDTPVTKPNALHSVWAAVNRQTRNGEILGADQRVSVYEALRAVTWGAAYGYFEEDTKGTLTPGKYADMVILDENPMEVNPEKIKDIQVVETILKGETAYTKNA